MKIAWLIDNLKLVGGAQRVVLLFAKAIQDKDIQFTVISLQENLTSPVPELLQTMGVKVVSFPGRNLRDLARFRRLVAYLKSEKFDILQTHLYYANIIGTCAGKLAGIPVVATIHSSKASRRRFHRIINPLEAYLLRTWANQVMAVGYSTAQEQAKRLKTHKIVVVPNAVEITDPISPAEKDARRKEMVGDASRTIIITVGRFAEVKGYQYLIQAFKLLRKDHPETALVFVGGGSLEKKLRAQVESASLSKFVTFMGIRDDVPELLAASDIYVNSSLWEGLPCTVLEAMAAGLPVVATDVGDNARVVINGTGLVVPPAQPQLLCDALSLLAGQQEMRQKLGNTARIHVAQNYNLNAWTNQLLQLYRSILPNSAWDSFQASMDY